jgi:sulfur carrier protein ThiS
VSVLVRVTVSVMGRFRSRLAAGRGGVVVELPQGSTVGDALRAIGMAESEPWNASIDGRLVESERLLRDGEELLVFTPIAGG